MVGIETIKKLIWFIIGFALFKIYEGQGYNNSITISVLVIIFALWVHFRLELNEQVETSNEEPFTPPLTPPTQKKKTVNSSILRRRPEKETKFRRLASRSGSN